MKSLIKYGIMFGTVLALAAGLGWAKSNNKAGNKTATVSLSVATTMPDGKVLQPGTYKVTVLTEQAAPQVEIYQNGKLVCKCPVTLEDLAGKAQYTRMEYTIGENGAHVLNGLAIGGWTQKVVFGASAQESTGS